MVKLLAYHGTRSGELANLHVEDVTTSMGVPVLRIHRLLQGALKNPASRREIPIHPKCRRIIAYARGRMSDTQKAKGPYLFGSFPEWKDGRGKPFQKDASTWLRKVVKITDRALTIHCLRHTWRTLAREIDMPVSVSLAIMGHTRGKGEHAAYGGDVSLKLRAKWIARIDPVA
jgi:integrase